MRSRTIFFVTLSFVALCSLLLLAFMLGRQYGLVNELPETGVSLKTSGPTPTTTPSSQNIYDVIEQRGGVIPDNFLLPVRTSTDPINIVSIPDSSPRTVSASWYDDTDKEPWYVPFHPLGVKETRNYKITLYSNEDVTNAYFEIQSTLDPSDNLVDEWEVVSLPTGDTNKCVKTDMVIRCTFPTLTQANPQTIQLVYTAGSNLGFRRLRLKADCDGCASPIYGWWHLGITPTGTERSDIAMRVSSFELADARGQYQFTGNRTWPIYVDQPTVRLIQDPGTEKYKYQYTLTSQSNVDIYNIVIQGMFSDFEYTFIDCPGAVTPTSCTIPSMKPNQTYQISIIPKFDYFQHLVITWDAGHPEQYYWNTSVGYLDFDW